MGVIAFLILCAGSRDFCFGMATRRLQTCGRCATSSATAGPTMKASTPTAPAASGCAGSASSISAPVISRSRTRMAAVWVVFNGEIYNYQDLRQDLIAKGHQFRTNSDTETLIHLYEEEGTDGLHKLRGMFAYCIWDSRRRKMLLVRDRFGKKPLYYATTPVRLVLRQRTEVPAAGRRPARSGPRGAEALLPVHLHCRSLQPVQGDSQADAGLLAGVLAGRLDPAGPLLAPAGVLRGKSEWPKRRADLRPDSRAVRRIRPHSHDRRRAAGRVPQRRHGIRAWWWLRWRCSRASR